jgi:AcrR family transcriptional regulator
MPAPPKPVVPTAPARERLASAAFAMFAEHGFDATTVEEIAEAAGVSRRTFFRHFPTKEDVIFPDHDRLRALVAEQLEMRHNEPPLVAVCNAVRLVLADYVRQKNVSLHRFFLTQQVAALREREVTSVHAYQRLFARYLRERLDDADGLQAELMAACVVSAHNATLRHWLRSDAESDAFAELESAFQQVQSLFANGALARSGTGIAGTTVAVFQSDVPMSHVLHSIQSAMNTPAPHPPRARARR